MAPPRKRSQDGRIPCRKHPDQFQRMARGGLSYSTAQEAYRLIVHTARATIHKGVDLKLATGFDPLGVVAPHANL
eukprot:4071301-Amphidinium_carterae.1